MLQYRLAAVAGLLTQVFWGVMLIMIYTAFYQSSGASHPLELAEVVSYVWLGQMMLNLQPWMLDLESRRIVASGQIAYELLRPVRVYWFWYWRALAIRGAPTLLRAFPMFVIALLFFDLALPATVLSGLLWLCSLFCAWLLAAAIHTLMMISMIWTISGAGITRLMPGLVMLFSGMIIPLPLFPDWLQPLIKSLPFRGLHDIPARIYLGDIEAAAAALQIAQQLIWVGVLVVLGSFLLSRGSRRLVIQGG